MQPESGAQLDKPGVTPGGQIEVLIPYSSDYGF